ncbi:MAG: TIGR04063 family PEP-CTERM/XrtA system glycosyltransferase [Desulfurivibrionaceae bacterium]
MKILHILDHSLPLHSGYTFRSQSIFRAQRQLGWEPVILTSPKHEQSWKGNWFDKEEINGFTYYRSGSLPESGSLPVLPELRLVRVLRRRLEDVLDREKPDIIHAHSPFLNAMAALKPAKKRKIPLVYEIRAFWEDAAVDHGSYAEGSWKYKLTRWMESMICQKADQVAVLCNGLKNDLIQRGIAETKITPVFNGINPEDFKPTPPDREFQEQHNLQGKKVIGFIGSFYRYEGLDLLIRAFARLAPDHPDLVLLLVGGGEMEPELKQLIYELEKSYGVSSGLSSDKVSQPLKGRIIMPGRLPHEKVPGIYSLIDILAYPRYSMRLTDLVTPLKPLEAMAMGKALVASDVGGHRELIRDGETGLLFQAGDERALTETLGRLLNDIELRRQIQSRAGEWVLRNHVWEKTTAVYAEMYKQ